ncbi:MAG: hypothetical protein JXQ90_20395 [Cyclobacteriaceae bacterium]
MILGVSQLSAQNYTKVKPTKEISLLIPEDFIVMDVGNQSLEYPSARQPIAMYTSPDRKVDLGINVNSSSWGSSNLEILKDFYYASILSLYDQVDFTKNEIIKVGKRDFICFEFVGTVVDEDAVGAQKTLSRFVHIRYTLYNEKVLLFNYSCPGRIKDQWSDVASTILNSVVIKK